MGMKLHLLLIMLLLLSCKDRRLYKEPLTTIPLVDTVQIGDNNLQQSIATLEEYYVDSLHIGRKSFNKVEMLKYRSLDSSYVIIKFYSKIRANEWILKQEFVSQKDGIVSCDPTYSDFNNDDHNDMTYISMVAARGANEIRRLFIYNKSKDQLVFLKNSEDFPNMLYNKKLNCIDAFLVHGGCSTVFLKIQGDSLKKFACVDLGANLIVHEFDKNGKQVVIRQDTATDMEYVRYENYKPLEEYKF